MNYFFCQSFIECVRYIVIWACSVHSAAMANSLSIFSWGKWNAWQDLPEWQTRQREKAPFCFCGPPTHPYRGLPQRNVCALEYMHVWTSMLLCEWRKRGCVSLCIRRSADAWDLSFPGRPPQTHTNTRRCYLFSCWFVRRTALLRCCYQWVI